MNKPITSREYKLILDTNRFKDRQQGAKDFLELFEYLVEEQGEKFKKKEREKERQTYYLDTIGLNFYQQGFILRVREEQTDNKIKMTLKYRHSDRYLSASKNLSSRSQEKNRQCKFEEDILASGSSKFSHSVSLKNPSSLKHPEKLWSPNETETVKDVIDLFPEVQGDDDLKDLHKDTKIQVVNGFKAHEIAHKLGHFSMSDTKIKAVLNFWYLPHEKGKFPLVVEFSFDYDLDPVPKGGQLEQFPLEVVKKTQRLFEALKRQKGWVSEQAITKTSYAYK
ncbi:MAG: hypothetical protein SVR94_13980 [Pseudomonadota bacterium]|nr:hypothetical protein [Pseudomonadota bacterium]